MNSVVTKFEAAYRKPKVTDVRSGDTVRVHQTVREGGKERTQVFEGMVIRERRKNSLTANITVRRIASGIGVEKTFFLHSPSITKVEVIKRTKVRRNFLSYMRERTGRSTRLTEREFDKEAVNVKEEAKKELTEEEKEELKKQAEEEKLSKKEEKAEKDDKSEKKEAKSDKKEEVSKEKEEKSSKEDKAAEKKAKAEEFRKAQEAKK